MQKFSECNPLSMDACSEYLAVKVIQNLNIQVSKFKKCICDTKNTWDINWIP